MGKTITAEQIEVRDGSLLVIESGQVTVTANANGVQSNPTGPNKTAFIASGGQGATAALDCGFLPVVNLPTSDPHVNGALWNNVGTPAISAG